MTDIYLSIIIPVYNEAENIAPLALEISEMAKKLTKPIEVIWIDDGSTDGTYSKLKEISVRNENTKIISFAGNFGQTAAIAAGIKYAKAEFIAILDGDGQNNPADIIFMLERLDKDYDIISGWRKNRKDDWFTRTFPSHIANKIISQVTGVHLHDYGCTLKIYRAEFLKNINLYGEMHRFMPALAANLGARIMEVEVNHRPRLKGKTKYTLMRTFKVLLDLITVKFMGRYLAKPIYIFGGFGFVLGIVSLMLAFTTLYNKYYHQIYVKDQPLFIVSIFLAVIAVQMISLGVLMEIVVRIYYETKNRPPYFIREKINL